MSRCGSAVLCRARRRRARHNTALPPRHRIDEARSWAMCTKETKKRLCVRGAPHQMKVMLFTFSERLSEECVRIAFITDKTYNTIRGFMKIVLNNCVRYSIP